MRVLIVDDEAMARKRLERLLVAMPGVEIAGTCEDGSEVASRVAESDVDVVLLDVQMTQMSGVEAMGLLPEDGPFVVFVTAHAEHAVFAFDAGAVDYVLKPVDPKRLARAIDRARLRVDAKREREPASADRSSPEPPLVDRFAIPTRKGLVIIDPKDVRYAIVDGESVVVHANDAAYVTDFRIVALEKRLPAELFVRAHRRVLLNLEHVVGLEPVGAGVYVAELTDGATVPVSRQAAKRLKALWQL